MTPVAVSRVQAMAGIFHPFVSLCFHCTSVHVNAILKMVLSKESIVNLDKYTIM